MDIENIKGNTYWIQSSTNVGIYVFEDREALLIDVGRCGKRQDNILKALEKENIEVKLSPSMYFNARLFCVDTRFAKLNLRL